MDRVKTRLQVQIQQQETSREDCKRDQSRADDPHYAGSIDAIKTILQQDGISGLYAGLESSVAGTASMNFAYFYWSAAAQTAYQQGLRYYGIEDSNGIIKEFSLGAAGGALAQLCTTPITVIATRQQTRKRSDQKQSMWETMMEIIHSEDGWTGLWRGFKVNLILVINPMITYGVYQWLRGGFVGLKKQLGSRDAFCSFCLPPGKVFPDLILFNFASARCPLKGSGNHHHASSHRGEDDVAIEAPTTAYRCTFPRIHRSPCLHCEE